MPSDSGHGRTIPSLDGIRAVSILIVFVAHAGLPVLVNGSSGVTIFFFLSGYLITTLLRIEQDRTGRLSLRDFYLRRILRIFPPMYVALALGILATVSGLIPGHVSAGGAAAQAGHLTNYWIVFDGRADVPTSTLAFWSLAVEEHFYLVFPLLLVGLAAWTGSRHRQAAVLAGICALVLVWRCWLVFGADAGFDRVYLSTDTRLDSILLGAVFALLANPVLDQVPGKRSLWVWGLMPVAGIVFWVAQAAPQRFAISVGYTIEGIALAVIFTAVVAFPESWAGRFLNRRAVAFIGVLSYSIYLLYELVIALVSKYSGHSPWVDGPIEAILVVAAAWVMYRLVERPLAGVRRRLSHAGEALGPDRSGDSTAAAAKRVGP